MSAVERRKGGSGAGWRRARPRDRRQGRRLARPSWAIGVAVLGWAVSCTAVQAQGPMAGESVLEEVAAEEVGIHPRWRSFEPAFVREICPFAEEGSYDPEQVECGYVLVPEDRTNPRSRLIQLAVMRFPSTSKEPAAGAILRLDGGPGGPSLTAERAEYYAGAGSDSLRAIGDVIFHDQRGIGYSEAAFCRAVPDAYQYGVSMGEEGFQRFRQRMRRCLEEARQRGIAVDAYSTWHNALDVRDLRRALGYEQWNLFGVSYGSQLAQAVIQVDPEGVRSAILDSAVPTTAGPSGGWGAVAAGFRSSLAGLDAACQADSGCAERFPNLAAALLQAIHGYDREPLELAGLDRRRFNDGRVVLDAELIALFTFQLLYDEANHGDLPVYVEVLESRDEAALRTYLDVAAWPIDHQVGQGMRLIANCRGSAPLTAAQQRAYRRREPELSRLLRYHETTETCAVSYSLEPDLAARPLRSRVPVLVGAGALDPVTPPALARQVLPGLSQAAWVEFPYSGHGVFLGGGCGAWVSRSFLLDPTSPPDSACVAEESPPTFLHRFRRDGSAFALVQRLRAGDWPWFSVAWIAVMLLGILLYALRFASRLVDRQPLGKEGGPLLSWAGLIVCMLALAMGGGWITLWMGRHPLAAPVALPPYLGLVGATGLVGCSLCLAGVWSSFRPSDGRTRRVSRLLGAVAAALLACGSVVLLQSAGCGI